MELDLDHPDGPTLGQCLQCVRLFVDHLPTEESLDLFAKYVCGVCRERKEDIHFESVKEERPL